MRVHCHDGAKTRAEGEERAGTSIVHNTSRMDQVVRIVVVAMLIAVIVSLGSALVHLTRGGSEKLVRALTWRIGLSMALFILLMIAWYVGLIRPHGFG